MSGTIIDRGIGETALELEILELADRTGGERLFLLVVGLDLIDLYVLVSKHVLIEKNYIYFICI